MSLIPEIDAFLGCPTPDAWIEAALADQETLLIDHKNCEKKSAIQLRIVRITHAA
ncbi:tRNA isopentenyl-2-thiomethyl-A-37 hydroxylase MiaE [Pseudomonas alloputida]|uniref:tRNA isopentenyl-2-thiomethyl-A-37 hydroxylase MiaE n=1 Tax=Pseudomonas alloputida TaxID=1940621 RepID=UPI0039FBCE60